MKNIAVALHAGTPEQRNSITNYFGSLNLSYWHWNDDLWIVQVHDSYTPKILHENLEANTDIGEPTVLVFEFTGQISYWGRQTKDAWEWLERLGQSG